MQYGIEKSEAYMLAICAAFAVLHLLTTLVSYWLRKKVERQIKQLQKPLFPDTKTVQFLELMITYFAHQEMYEEAAKCRDLLKEYSEKAKL